jgi:hypothetical protein
MLLKLHQTGYDEHGPAYPLPPEQCRVCRTRGVGVWCERDNCPGRNAPPIEFSSRASVTCAPCLIIAMIMGLAITGAVIFALIRPAHAFDHGFDHNSEASQYFDHLLRHDAMPKPCCGEADAYIADRYVRNPDGSYEVMITDGEDDHPWPDGTERIPLKNGSWVHVPENQINPPEETKHNPTGHAWLFVSIRRGYDDDHPGGNAAEPGLTYCFAPLPEGS